MGNEFLYKEYELSYQQFRFYDERQSDLLKFVFVLTSSIVTAQFAILKFIGSPTNSFYLFQTLISFLLFLAILICYISMVQNRLYFVYIARQINSLRGYFLETEAQEFKDKNQLYTSTDFSAVKLSSLHTLQMIGVSIVSTLFGSISVYSFSKYYYLIMQWWGIGAISILIFFAEIFCGFKYLKTKSNKNADEAIHLK